MARYRLGEITDKVNCSEEILDTLSPQEFLLIADSQMSIHINAVKKSQPSKIV